MTDNLRLSIRKWMHLAIGVVVLLYGVAGFSGLGVSEAYAQQTRQERVPPYQETYEVQVSYEESYEVEVTRTREVQRLNGSEQVRVSPFSESYQHRVAPLSESGRQRVAPLTESYQQRVSPFSESYQHRVAPFSESGRQRVAPFTESYQQRVSPFSESYQHRVAPFSESGQQRVAPFTESYQQRVSPFTESYQQRVAPFSESGRQRVAPFTESYCARYANTPRGRRCTETRSRAVFNYVTRTYPVFNYVTRSRAVFNYETRSRAVFNYVTRTYPVFNYETRSRAVFNYETRSRAVFNYVTRTYPVFNYETRSRAVFNYETRSRAVFNYVTRTYPVFNYETRSRAVFNYETRPVYVTVTETYTVTESRTRTAYRTETRTREVFNYATVPVAPDIQDPDDPVDPTCPHGGVYPDCDSAPGDWEHTWASDQLETVLSHPTIGEDDIPENPNADSTVEDLEKLIEAMGDEPGFVADDAQAILDQLKPGQKITRNKMAEILCAGSTTCTDDPDDGDDQIHQIAGEDLTIGYTGICVINPNSPECVDDFSGENTMTNAQLVTFISRLLGNNDGDGGTDNTEDTAVNNIPQDCPAGWTGTYPDCVAPVQDCPNGWTGTYPNCVAPVVNPPPQCPAGWTGTPPDCVAPVQDCPNGWTGTYPNCVAPTPLPVVSFSANNLFANEGGSVTIFAILDAVPASTASVRFNPSGATNGNGSCSAGADYYVSSSVFTFTNSISASVTLTACDDSDLNDETVTLSLTTTGISGLQRGAPSTSMVSISDDDVAVSFERTAYSVDEGEVGTIRVQLNRAPGRTVTIPITTTAQSGATRSDYSSVPTGITFLSGDTSRIISFAATQDDIDDDNESVRLGFGTLPAGVFAGAERHATVSINDDDGTIIPPPLPVVSLSSVSLTVNESMWVTVSASLDRAPGGTASVRFNPSGATNGNGSCSTGADFYVDDTEFTFTSTTSASVTLHACDDTDTNDENVTLSLTTIGISGLQLGSPTTVQVTITDDDTSSAPLLK